MIGITNKRTDRMEFKELIPLKWPEGWGRTFIDQRKHQGAWKKMYGYYEESVVKELERLGASSATISHNDLRKQDKDPGIAVWFSLKMSEDHSWQTELQIDNPNPTEDEIRQAFRRVAGKHHPDQVANGSGGDVKMYLRLDEHKKKAMAWVRGDAAALDNCIPCDRFTEARQNLAAVSLALKAFRQLERVGVPSILERVMEHGFRTALPVGQGVASGAAST